MSKTDLSVAFQRERGAYSETAAVNFFGDSIQVMPCTDFDCVFEAVTQGQAKRGVLPVENSLAGSIHRNYDLLLRYELSIVGEVQIPIAHQLIALPGVTLADVKKVYSHPQALAQCEHSITKLLPHAERVTTYDTAGSVKMIKEKNITAGAGLAMTHPGISRMRAAEAESHRPIPSAPTRSTPNTWQTMRTNPKTPALTTATACRSELTGVGATMALGSHA